ncbi:MAG: bifunctional diaminohydroxyphosphoribosylaminopyrimidine deaminase/5-amino-6-(5-phosphoribosylamino)uracil reductase RibD [Legionellales bacterium]|nr:bifunctional diaminohydroxyphosphoribosylaminopyrimidine deaminase/5-amino-6-(5-phosphoribosylamino)uracil reductase RibD [Legionellales bacterium]
MHEQFLLAALDQAWLGRGLCSPNPSVGAVAVQNGHIIAQTWHRGAGTAHAERLLLDKLPQNISDLTLYVTLEPCNHWGKTPPCVDAILAYGVKKVVYAYKDPNPLVMANDTPALLRAHGIEVLHHPLKAIDDFYQSYRHWTLTRRPWVTVKLAQSLDGKIAGMGGERISLSNELCAQFTHQSRLRSDVILTTARTIQQDDPLLNVRLTEQSLSKPVAVIVGRDFPHPKSNIFTTASHCHLYYEEHLPRPSPLPNTSFYPMPVTAGLLSLDALIQHLGQLGYHDVWVEAGGTLFSALHQARCVNKTYLYIVPRVLGDGALPAYHGSGLFEQANHVSYRAMGDNLLASFEWHLEDICSLA